MDIQDFRRHAHEVVDWMADYMESVRSLPVVPRTQPGEIQNLLPESPPEHGEPFETIMEDFRNLIVPGMTHWNHPGWFAYFPANTSPPSVLAEMLTAAIGAQCMSWQTSPAATELEQVVMEWLRGMLGLPAGFTGVIQDTASTATLVALLTAREKATDYAFSEKGAAAEGAGRLTVYASTQIHSSIDKGVKMAGLGLDHLRKIPVDDAYAMIPDALEESIQRDLDQGLRPCCVTAVVGSTSSTAIDPLEPIGEICERYNVWLHVDAAYAGTAAILPEKRSILNGIERADSFVFNPHKWMFTNFDCSVYFVKDVDALLRTLSTTPEYLRTTHDQDVANFRDWGIQLGRRFRALKLWFVIRTYGVEGIRRILRNHIQLAQEFATWVGEHMDFEVMAPVKFGLVCFRYRPAKEHLDEAALEQRNARLLEAVNETGRVHLTHTKLEGRYVIRMSIGQLRTTREEVEEAWRLFVEKAEEL